MSKGRKPKNVDREQNTKHSNGKNGTKRSGKRNNDKSSNNVDLLETKGLDNNPNWYYLNAELAEQASQIAFQQLAGQSIDSSVQGSTTPVANIINMYLNPCPGVQTENNIYVTGTYQAAGINLAGFRLWSKMTAYTGRQATYGPQDISTMILSFGEIISKIEYIRRAFGVAYQINPRNRAYPIAILHAMGIDAANFHASMSDYRMAFNAAITRVNQLPIPMNIAYFDKCASLYEKLYLDMPSSMAQTIITVPSTSWILDETSYSGGTVLRTTSYRLDKDQVWAEMPIQTMAWYINDLNNAIDALMNSSTLQVVYTDLLNLAIKQSVPFWRFDYLSEGYMVVPEFNLNFMIQFHNSTATGNPCVLKDDRLLSRRITPYNDVYPNAANNSLIFNPVMSAWDVTQGTERALFPQEAILDLPNDNPTLEERVEFTRFLSLSQRVCDDDTVVPPKFIGWQDNALPDHYVVHYGFKLTNNTTLNRNGSSFEVSSAANADLFQALSQIDWAPRFYGVDGSNNYQWTGTNVGELNFYTLYKNMYLARLNDFIALALYDMR